jgi:hypothetical protein
MSRVPWDADFPDVIVHAAWKAKPGADKGLWDHPLYSAAKSQRDEYSALTVIVNRHSIGALTQTR